MDRLAEALGLGKCQTCNQCIDPNDIEPQFNKNWVILAHKHGREKEKYSFWRSCISIEETGVFKGNPYAHFAMTRADYEAWQG